MKLINIKLISIAISDGTLSSRDTTPAIMEIKRAFPSLSPKMQAHIK